MYRPSPNISRYSSKNYAEVSKAQVNRDDRIVTVWFQSHGEVGDWSSCIKIHGDSLNPKETKTDSYEMGVYEIGTFEFEYMGRGLYKFNYFCNDQWTDITLFDDSE